MHHATGLRPGRDPRRWTWAAALVVAVTAQGLRAQAASPGVAATVSARIASDLSKLDGVVELTVPNPGPGALSDLDLWTFPQRLAVRPAALGEVEATRVFPEGFSPGAMRIGGAEDASGRALTVSEVSTTLWRVRLAEPLPAGATATIRVAFETEVPHRFGPFGHANGQLTVDGGWFPRPPPLRAGRFEAASPPDDLRWRANLTADSGGTVIVNGHVETLARGASAGFVGGVATRLCLVLFTAAHHSELRAPSGLVTMVHRRPRHRESGMPDLGWIDVHAEALGTAAVGLRLAREASPTAVPRVLLVEAPLRRDIALPAPGMVLVSDRAFEVTPLERFLKFHRVALLRAQLAVAVTSALEREPPWYRPQVVGVCAEELVARWEQATYGSREGARDVLATGSFVSAVDDILNAPQVPFPTTYFRVVDDTDRLRDRFELFSHRRPNGRIWRERLRDQVGAAAVASVVDDLLSGAALLTEALAAHAGDVGLAWLEQWRAGPPAVNYRLVDVRAAAGGGIDIHIAREGRTTLSEPVTILVIPTEGPRVRRQVTVDGPVAVAHIPGPVGADAAVFLDPGYRLVESDLGKPVDPRYDNANSHPWRFLLEGVFFDLNTAAGRINLSVSGLLRRANDPRHLFVVGAYELERQLGASVGYIHYFGPKLRANRLRFGVGTGVAASWLKPFDGEASGAAVALSVSLFDFTYKSRTDPRAGAWLTLRVGPRIAWRPGRTEVGGFVQARAARVLELGDGHLLAGQLRLGSVFGVVGQGSEIGLGGFGAVRAFSTFAQSGRHRALLNVEWRHTWSRDLSIDLFHLIWIHGLDGVLFADAALLADSPTDMGEPEALFVGAGYGLRLHYLVAGFHPMVLSVDLGVPVVTGGGLGPGDGAPFSLVVGLGQAF